MAYTDTPSTSSNRKKRAPRMTMAQASYLANFMLRNKEFAMRTPSTEEGEKKKKEGWKRLALELNSLSGSNKKVEGWKKAWLDLKRTSRLRVTKILREKGPGLDIDKCNISDLDRRVLEAIGIAVKVGDYPGNITNDDEELTFVGIKESDDSCDFLGVDAAEEQQIAEQNQEDDDDDYDVKDNTSLSQLKESINYRSRKQHKRTSSCTEHSEDGSNYSDESYTQEYNAKEKRKQKKTKVKKRKSEDTLIEKVLRDLQDDYTSGLKAIADAITKVGASKTNVQYQPKSKRISQPWFHYLKFDN